jgi:MFS family permease
MAQASAPNPPPRRRLRGLVLDPAPLRHDRDYRLLWAGQAISAMGRLITRVVLPYQIYVLTNDLLAVGLLSIVQLVPILIFSLGGGAVADAVDRRRLLLITQVALMGCSVALVALALVPAPPLLALYAVAFLSAGLASIDQPARASSIPRLVPPHRLPAAIALNTAVFNASAIVGPAVGGIVLAMAGIAAAYVLDVLTYLAAIVALLLMKPIPPAAGFARASIGSIVEGLRFAASRRSILATFLVDLNAMVFGSPQALFPALALDVFRVGPAGVGFMASAAGVGALVAALFSGWTASVARPGRAVLVAVGVWGLGIIGFGLAVFSFPLALLFLAIASGADVISAVLRSSMLQVLTPDSLRGRVSSIHVLVVTGGPRVGDVEATAVATVVGPAGSVVAGGVLTLLGLGAIHLAMPEFARLRLRLDEGAPPDDEAPPGHSAAVSGTQVAGTSLAADP